MTTNEYPMTIHDHDHYDNPDRHDRNDRHDHYDHHDHGDHGDHGNYKEVGCCTQASQRLSDHIYIEKKNRFFLEMYTNEISLCKNKPKIRFEESLC